MIHPFDEFFAVIIMSVYETGMSGILPQNPLRIRNAVRQRLGNKRRTQIGYAAADQGRDLNLASLSVYSKSFSVPVGANSLGPHPYMYDSEPDFFGLVQHAGASCPSQ